MDKKCPKMSKNVYELYQAIQQKRLGPYTLDRKDRLQIVAFLRNDGNSPQEIANFLGLCDKTIYRDIRDIKRNAAQLVDEISVRRVAGELIREAEILISKTKKAKDYKLTWQIRCDLIDKLQSMGFVYKVPDKLEHSGQIKAAETKIYNIINNLGSKEINDYYRNRTNNQQVDGQSGDQEVPERGN